jgi:hypothetical protein
MHGLHIAQHSSHATFLTPPPPPVLQGIKKMIPRGLKKEQKEELESGEKILAWLEEGKDVRFGEWGLRWGTGCWLGCDSMLQW